MAAAEACHPPGGRPAGSYAIAPPARSPVWPPARRLERGGGGRFVTPTIIDAAPDFVNCFERPKALRLVVGSKDDGFSAGYVKAGGWALLSYPAQWTWADRGGGRVGPPLLHEALNRCSTGGGLGACLTPTGARRGAPTPPGACPCLSLPEGLGRKAGGDRAPTPTPAAGLSSPGSILHEGHVWRSPGPAGARWGPGGHGRVGDLPRPRAHASNASVPGAKIIHSHPQPTNTRPPAAPHGGGARGQERG